MTILAMDIGAGTQDLLLYEKGVNIENCIKLVLPTRAVLLARRVEQHTAKGDKLFLSGQIMGSGFLSSAIKKHIAAGNEVYASAQAAKTFRDNLDEVRAMGIKIAAVPPAKMAVLELSDIDLAPLYRFFNEYGKDRPSQFLISVQDHGVCCHGSNRKVRFRYWGEFLSQGGDMKTLLFSSIPPFFTRMHAVWAKVTGSRVMDTGPSALLGSLYDPVVRARQEAGVILLNVGNQHTLAALVKKKRVYGLMEHHTCFMSAGKIAELVDKLRCASLSDEEVFNEKGHGCSVHNDYKQEDRFMFVSVTGPRRSMVKALDYHQAAPFGDMMMTGCIGLLGAAGLLKDNDLL